MGRYVRHGWMEWMRSDERSLRREAVGAFWCGGTSGGVFGSSPMAHLAPTCVKVCYPLMAFCTPLNSVTMIQFLTAVEGEVRGQGEDRGRLLERQEGHEERVCCSLMIQDSLFSRHRVGGWWLSRTKTGAAAAPPRELGTSQAAGVPGVRGFVVGLLWGRNRVSECLLRRASLLPPPLSLSLSFPLSRSLSPVPPHLCVCACLAMCLASLCLLTLSFPTLMCPSVELGDGGGGQWLCLLFASSPPPPNPCCQPAAAGRTPSASCLRVSCTRLLHSCSLGVLWSFFAFVRGGGSVFCRRCSSRFTVHSWTLGLLVCAAMPPQTVSPWSTRDRPRLCGFPVRPSTPSSSRAVVPSTSASSGRVTLDDGD